MKPLLTILLVFLGLSAQAQADTLKLPGIQKADTLLQYNNPTLDSLEQAFTTKADSLKQDYAKQKEKIISLKTFYQNKADSLTGINLPATAYTTKADSLEQQLQSLQQRTTAKIDSLKSKVTGQLAKIKLPKGAESQAEKINALMDNVNLPSIDSDLTGKLGIDQLNTSMLGLNLPNTGSLPNTDLPNINSNLPNANLPGTGVNVPDVNASIPQPGINTGQVGEIQQKANEIAGAVSSPEAVTKTVEQKAAEQVKGLPDKNLPEQALPGGIPKTEEEAKEQLVQLAKKEATNHFAGKEAALMNAMEKMSKYKQKYNSVNSIKDLPTTKANSLKGKPLYERLVPALTLQVQSWEHIMLDVNPSVGYKLNSNIVGGIGWNQRWAYNIPGKEFKPGARIYGIRTYGEYNFKKGFGIRLDIESINTPVKPINLAIEQPQTRDWVWSALVGVKQKYPIYKKLKGNAQVMYNLFDPNHRSPYVERLNFRIGMEYTIRKKKKTEKEASASNARQK